MLFAARSLTMLQQVDAFGSSSARQVADRSTAGAMTDYDFESECVIVRAERDYSPGEEVRLPWGGARNSADLALTYGACDEIGIARDDFLTMSFGLLPSDPLYAVKAGVLAELGYDADNQVFPIHQDRFPTQLLNYLRLSRVADIALLAKLSMDEDIILSQMNEYETLQLLMSDVRNRMEGFDETDTVSEQQLLRDADLSEREALAATVRLCEKQVLQGTMVGVRSRLAPIRGVPTKGGRMEDPNKDIADLFESVENLPRNIISGKLFSGLFE